jgi:hypothetical protein
MASLNRHLLEPGDHGRLGFHPACPVCRQERLLGALPPEQLFSRRARAVLATGVLAFSTAAPGVAVAGDPDRQQEGVVAPDQSNPAAPQEPGADRPGYDPGGDSSLPYETGPTVDGPGGNVDPNATDDAPGSDPAPLDAEPLQDPDAPSVPLDGQDLQAAPGADPDPVAPVDSPTPAPSAPLQTGSGREALQDTDAAGPGSSHRHSLSLRAPAPEPYVPQAPDGEAPSPAPVQVNTTPVSAAPEPADVPSAGQHSDIPQGSRTHVVEQGESLWSIASDLLGPSASDGAIAHEVARLWQLNKGRIGTGDPDLLPAGTRLLLP